MPCFFYMPYHFTTPRKPAQTTRKPKRTIFLEQNFSVHIKRRSTVCADMTRTRPLNFSPPKEEIPVNGEEIWQMHKLTLIITLSHCKGVDFRSRRRHRCLRFCILQIIGKRSQLDSVRSQFFWGMLDNMENSIELQTGPWRTELLRECTKGSLVPLVQSAKDFNKLQWYRSGN